MADEKKVLDYNGLLYYHTGLKSLFLSDVSYDSTNAKITKTKNGQTTDVVTATTLKTAMSLNNVGNFKAVSTVANQGLTEEEKANARSNIGAGSSGFSGSFTDLTDVPTTIAGYGITDAGISSGTITLGANTITPLTSSDVTSTYSSSGTAPVNGTAVASAISGKANAATTLAGYGITDAKIASGTITLGANSITPLTSSDVTSTYSSSGTAPVNGTAVASAISGKADTATTIAGYGITDAKITSGTITLGANSFKGVSVAANQGLTTTEQENARANLGITLTEIYKFKGSVATVSALDNIVTKDVGDVYNVTANGVNYAWTGTAWDALGGEFEITSISNSEIDAILNGTASSS